MTVILPEKKQQKGLAKKSGQRSKLSTVDKDGDAEMTERDNDAYNFDEYF